MASKLTLEALAYIIVLSKAPDLCDKILSLDTELIIEALEEVFLNNDLQLNRKANKADKLKAIKKLAKEGDLGKIIQTTLKRLHVR